MAPCRQSVRLRRLLRAERRLLELCRHPDDERLRIATTKGWQAFSYLYPVLAGVGPESVHRFLPLLSACQEAQEAQEKRLTFQRWHHRLEEDPVKQINWVKQSAQEDCRPALLRPDVHDVHASHPSLRIREAEFFWTQI